MDSNTEEYVRKRLLLIKVYVARRTVWSEPGLSQSAQLKDRTMISGRWDLDDDEFKYPLLLLVPSDIGLGKRGLVKNTNKPQLKEI
jgi:hypothetical protein